MLLLLRILSLALALSMGGAFEALAAVVDARPACTEEEEDACADCAPDCGLCPCCPARTAAPVYVAQAVELSPAPPQRVALPMREPVVSAASVDIFQPPRA